MMMSGAQWTDYAATLATEHTRFVRGLSAWALGQGEYAPADGGAGARYKSFEFVTSRPTYAISIGPRSTCHELVIASDAITDVSAGAGNPVSRSLDAITVGVANPWIGYLKPGRYRVWMGRPMAFSKTVNYGRRWTSGPVWDTLGDEVATMDLIFHHSPAALPGLSSTRQPHEVTMRFDSSQLGFAAANWLDNVTLNWLVHSQGRRRFDFVFADTGAGGTSCNMTIVGQTAVDAGDALITHNRTLVSLSAVNNIDTSLTDMGEYDAYRISITKLSGGTPLYAMKATVRD